MLQRDEPAALRRADQHCPCRCTPRLTRRSRTSGWECDGDTDPVGKRLPYRLEFSHADAKHDANADVYSSTLRIRNNAGAVGECEREAECQADPDTERHPDWPDHLGDA